MPPINQMFGKIKVDHPKVSFKDSDFFGWSSDKQVVMHPKINTTKDLWLLLHELAHSNLKHDDYKTDIELLQMERGAWDYAKSILAPKYSLVISKDCIEEHLDTYRDWLHNRSLCPKCNQNGVQETQSTYRCMNCRCLWGVNEARTCGLKRKLL